jgi:hypothetical protein
VVQQKQYYSMPFNNDDTAVPKPEDLTADILQNHGYFLVKIGQCNFKTSYPFPINKPSSQTYQLEVRVNHTPNLINICHFEFQCWSDYNNNGIPKVVKKGNNPETFREQIVHAIRNVMMDNIHSVNVGK